MKTIKVHKDSPLGIAVIEMMERQRKFKEAVESGKVLEYIKDNSATYVSFISSQNPPKC